MIARRAQMASQTFSFRMQSIDFEIARRLELPQRLDLAGQNRTLVAESIQLRFRRFYLALQRGSVSYEARGLFQQPGGAGVLLTAMALERSNVTQELLTFPFEALPFVRMRATLPLVFRAGPCQFGLLRLLDGAKRHCLFEQTAAFLMDCGELPSRLSEIRCLLIAFNAHSSSVAAPFCT
jgi:hypothetical protein